MQHSMRGNNGEPNKVNKSLIPTANYSTRSTTKSSNNLDKFLISSREPKNLTMDKNKNNLVTNKNLDEKLDHIMQKMDLLSIDIAAEVNKQLVNIKSSILEEVTEVIRVREDEWRKEKAALEKRVEYLEKCEETRLRQAGGSDVVIRGLSTSEGNATPEVVELFKDKLGVEVNVANSSVMKITKGRQIIVAKMNSFEDKRVVLSNKKKLIGSSLSISHDRTKKERQIQSQLTKIAEEERSKGKTVYVGYRKVTIDGVTSFWDDSLGLIPSRRSTSPPSSQLTAQTAGSFRKHRLTLRQMFTYYRLAIVRVI